MAVVLLHGAPVTPVVWAPLLARMPDLRTISPQLPGFGTPLPQNFAPTMDQYADWFATLLADIDEPVDLVAQDWGAIIALRVLAERPANLRSWVLDAADLTEDFEWHGSAKFLQSKEADAVIAKLVAAPLTERAQGLASTGLDASITESVAAVFDETMGHALLSLYRSAVNIGKEWGPRIDDIEGPGLVIEAGKDPFRADGSAARFATRTGASLVAKPELGHWWMLEDPDDIEEMLRTFWGAL